MAININKKISVIIPNFNGRDFLEVCLASLSRQSFTDFELVVVDNGSTDDSLALVNSRFPEANIYKFKENKGFSCAVNQGLKMASGEYLFLLNNDTELQVDCLKNINDFLDSRSDVSIVATKMIFFDNRKLLNDVGDVFSVYGIAHQRGKEELDNGQYDKIEAVFGACAGAAVYRRKLFEDIGFFDEDFFAYLEDVDLCFRAQIKGYKCFYLPSAVVYHVDGGTSKKIPNFSRFLTLRNGLYVVFKNFHWSLLFLLSPFLVLSQVRNIFVGIKHRCPFLIFKVYFDFFRNLPVLWKKRLLIQSGRRVSAKYLLGILSKKYPFSIKKSFHDFFSNHR